MSGSRQAITGDGRKEFVNLVAAGAGIDQLAKLPGRSTGAGKVDSSHGSHKLPPLGPMSESG
jgi:hypothetical protein